MSILYDILHGVQTRGLAFQELHGSQRTVGKEAAVFCLMLQGDGLSTSGDNDLMGTHFITQAQGVNADLLSGTLAVFMAANQQNGIGECFLNAVSQQQRSAAGDIQLLVVVLFNDLDVGTGEHGSGALGQIGIHSLRLGNEVGTHEIILSTGNETITIKHEAESRTLFADGALAAAAFLGGKSAALYSMQDMINS